MARSARGLAGAVRTDEPDDAAGLDREIDVVERDVRAVFLGQVASFDERGHGSSFFFGFAAAGRRRRVGERGRLREQFLRPKIPAG